MYTEPESHQTATLTVWCGKTIVWSS